MNADAALARGDRQPGDANSLLCQDLPVSQ
jgi:hypothetical protein